MRFFAFILLLLIFTFQLKAQDFLNKGELHGDFQTNIQYYNKDDNIDAKEVPEDILFNGYANLLYRNGGFTAGLRYENYMNPLLGYDAKYKGSGIPYKFASYENKSFSITAGSFYEQFGSGMILRFYEDRDLGFDNALDGFKLRFQPHKALVLKGIIGKQRYYFDKGEGIVRGIDAELSLNELICFLDSSKSRINIGGSTVSKFQADNNSTYILPENVAAFAGRLSYNYTKFHFEGEYVYKINDPYPSEYKEYNYIYRRGEALLLSGSYSTKGFAFMLRAKRIDNMFFRSDINATGNDLLINYMPALSMQYHYSMQNFFPYASHPNGEMGIQAQLNYKIKKESVWGGKYGTELMLSYSRINAIEKDIFPYESHLGYNSRFFKIGKELYFEDVAFELNKKLSKMSKFSFAANNIIYNNNIIKGFEWKGFIYANIFAADFTQKLNDKNALRIELQHLNSEQYKKNWALALLEFSVSPNWSFTIFDQYNYNNPIKSKRLHYYNAGLGYSKETAKIQLIYGRRVEGVMCIGGVCRYLPAANGLTLIINYAF